MAGYWFVSVLYVRIQSWWSFHFLVASQCSFLSVFGVICWNFQVIVRHVPSITHTLDSLAYLIGSMNSLVLFIYLLFINCTCIVPWYKRAPVWWFSLPSKLRMKTFENIWYSNWVTVWLGISMLTSNLNYLLWSVWWHCHCVTSYKM